MSTNYDTFRERVAAYLNQSVGHHGQLLSLEGWRQYRKTEEPRLDARDMHEVIARAIEVLQGLYVHLALKRARRGVDPISQLRALASRVEPSGALDTRVFHATMLTIFKSLGDVHTAYRLPPPSSGAVAFLPFLMSACFDDDSSEPRFVVSRLLGSHDESLCEAFVPGTEITTWNGTPIAEAVRRSTDLEEGSNPAHDLALGLQSMTMRWLGASFEPDAPWAMVGYRAPGSSALRECQFWWSVYVLKGGPRILVTEQAKSVLLGGREFSAREERSVNTSSQVAHAYRKWLYVPDEPKPDAKTLMTTGEALRQTFSSYVGRRELRAFSEQHAALFAACQNAMPGVLPHILTARTFSGAEVLERGERAAVRAPALAADERARLREKRFGYIGIRAFPLEGFDRDIFKYELRRLLSLMPGDGLIVDVRDNPGGSARNAEESLQFLTPNRITPLPFRLAATSLTQTLASQPGSPFAEYASSVDAALRNAADFSAGLAVTEPEHANAVGQHYFGPVALLTNAMSYSAADIFAAGFQDNKIGPIFGTDETTGAGGANCLFYNEEIEPVLGLGELPAGINMQVAVRQCTRVGDRNAGVPIEEVGVATAHPHRLSRADVVDGTPWSLLLRAAQALAAKPRHDLETELERGTAAGTLAVVVKTTGIARVDFYLNGRPTSHEVVNDATRFEFAADGWVKLEMLGYSREEGARLVARYVQDFDVQHELARLASPPASEAVPLRSHPTSSR